MEKKQLNFNAPLLSVRKSGPIFGSSDKANKKIVEKSVRQQSLPIKNSDRDLAEVTKPAAVPFMWERIPGRPKDECDSQTETPRRSSSTPRLPPGRVTDVVRRNSGERPINESTYKSQFEVYPLNDHAALLESLRESIYANGESDLESVDDAYSDALDAISPAESLSLNCSITGLSGSEVPDKKPSGTFSVDQQTRDFMMSRFLPAAKAVVLETPQYIPRKQSISAEQPKKPLVAELTKQVKKVTTDERTPLLDHYRSNLVLSNTRYTEDVKSEAEDDEHDDHGNDRGKRSGKAWGFFPRLCVKKSLSLLNPVPAMKTKTQVPKSPTIDVSRLTRKAYSGPLDKPTWDSSNKKRFHSGVLSRELHRVETRVCDPNQLSYSRASYKAGGLSPCRPFRSGGISPYRNSRPQSPFSKGASFLGMPKELENLTTKKYSYKNNKCSNSQDAPSPHVRKQEVVSSSSVAEKTLYIDSVKSVNPVKDLASSEAAKLANSPDKNLETSARNRRMENSPANSHVQEARLLDNINRGTKADSKSSVWQDTVLTSSACISKVRGITERYEDAKMDKCVSRESRLDYMNNQPDAQTDPSADTLLSPQPPPLPKSPSESWLWRTVPSIHLHNPFSLLQRGNLHSKKLGEKASATGTKWEMIVKTSNVRHDLGRYSEELSPQISHKQDRR